MEVITGNLYQVVGVAGFLLYILSYFLLQIGILDGAGTKYTLMNLTAASFVLVSLVQNFNLASVLIQITWILISFIGIVRVGLRSLKRVSNNS